jgi:hypothetical protein
MTFLSPNSATTCFVHFPSRIKEGHRRPARFARLRTTKLRELRCSGNDCRWHRVNHLIPRLSNGKRHPAPTEAALLYEL